MNVLSQEQVNSQLLVACTSGDVEKVKELLSSPDLLIKAQVDSQNYLPLYVANQYGHIDVVRYIFNETKAKETTELAPELLSQLLQVADANEYDELVHYFIFELDMSLSEDLQSFLTHQPHLRELFDTREMHRKLDNSLSQSLLQRKASKI